MSTAAVVGAVAAVASAVAGIVKAVTAPSGGGTAAGVAQAFSGVGALGASSGTQLEGAAGEQTLDNTAQVTDQNSANALAEAAGENVAGDVANQAATEQMTGFGNIANDVSEQVNAGRGIDEMQSSQSVIGDEQTALNDQLDAPASEDVLASSASTEQPMQEDQLMSTAQQPTQEEPGMFESAATGAKNFLVGSEEGKMGGLLGGARDFLNNKDNAGLIQTVGSGLNAYANNQAQEDRLKYQYKKMDEEKARERKSRGDTGGGLRPRYAFNPKTGRFSQVRQTSSVGGQ